MQCLPHSKCSGNVILEAGMLSTRNNYEQQVIDCTGIEETGVGRGWLEAGDKRGRRTEIYPGDRPHPRRAITLVQAGVRLVVG